MLTYKIFGPLKQMLSQLFRLFILVYFTPMLCLAQSDMQLISTDSVVRLSPQLKIFAEQGKPLDIFDIKNKKSDFTWQSGLNPNYGFHKQAIWLYTSVSNVTDEKHWVLDVAFSQLERIDIYFLEDNKIIAQSLQNNNTQRQHHRLPTLEVTLPYAKKIDLFIRIEHHQSSILAPIDIQALSKHKSATFIDNLLWGLFYGGLIMLGAYNLILYFGYRDNSLIAYVAFILSVLLWQLVWGGHFRILFPEDIATWFNLHIDLIFIIVGITSGIFAIALLDAEKTAPKSIRYIKISLLLFTLLIFTCITDIFPSLVQNIIVFIVSFIALVSYTYVGFESYSNRFYAARFYIFALCILACCEFIALLNLFGKLPVNVFTSYCFQVGLFIEACLFSVALIEKNRHQLQMEVEQTTEDLRNNIELVEEQNVRLDIARKEAIMASNVKSQFLANMSHEIRTPLNAILGFSKELHSPNLPIEKQEQVNIINAATDNLLNIVNDVLDFSKIEAGKLRINNHPFSPNQVLEDVISIMAKTAHLKKLEFVYDVAPLPEKLIGDSYRIKQILNNLLGNALKFTDQGHVSLFVRGKEKEHGIYELILKIEDSGIGISRVDQRKLFAAFSQVDDALNRSYQGTGLGLVICQELVKLMRGELSLQSTPAVGSIFTVTIRNNLLNTNLSIKPYGPWQDKKVVYFDPYPLSRHAGVKMLRAMGANVTGVESLAFLRTIQEQQDTLFISIPGAKTNLLPSILEAMRHTNSTNTIMLYSGTESLSNRTDLERHFQHKIRLPLTLGKLNSLLNAPVKAPINAIQKRLEALPSAKVLAVDDMEINLRLLSTWFKNSNLQLTLAYSGKDAVEQCKYYEFDLILMDVQMPNMDGLEATKLIRQTPLNLGTPIIAVTAHAFKEEQERLLSSGMDDYLPKPVNLSDLIDLIKRWCQVPEPENQQLESFDWQLALQRANFNEEATLDILNQFIKQLPDLTHTIEQASDALDFEAMQRVIHQLHGACCYTGVPALHALCDEIESLLKKELNQQAHIKLPKLLKENAKILELVKQEKIRLV